MDESSKVLWKEGMFVSPQHFQQQERYFNWYINRSFSISSGYQPRVGLITLEINYELLKIGKFAVSNASGLFADGSYFEQDAELVTEIPADTHEQTLYLTLPVSRRGAPEVLEDDGSSTRYLSKQVTVFDNASADNSSAQIFVAYPNLELQLEGGDLSGFLAIPVARVLEMTEAGEIVLDENFIPMCAAFGASTHLVGRVKEIDTLMRSRARFQLLKITSEANPSTQHTLFREYLRLQTLYRWIPWFSCILETGRLDLQELYLRLCQLDAELASLVPEPCPDPEVLDASKAYPILNSVLSSLRQRLTLTQSDSVVEFDWDSKLFEDRRLLRASIGNPAKFSQHRFFLSVQCNPAIDDLPDLFRKVAKLSGVGKIAELVRSSLSGIDLIPLPFPPPELKPEEGVAFFRVDMESPLWRDLVQSKDSVALHIDTRIPNPRIRLFAIA